MTTAPFEKRLAHILFVLFIAFYTLFLFIRTNEADTDLWGHLKFGQDIAEQLSVPRFDTYSYSAYGNRWINHEWFSELIFYSAHKYGGSGGLLFLKFAVFLALWALLFARVNSRTNSLVLKLIFLALPFAEISKGFAFRPQIFTYLFFTILLLLITRFEETSKIKPLYCLPVLFLCWCNCHGGFVMGAGFLLLYTLYKAAQGKSSRQLLTVTALSLAATLINPYGAGLWTFLAHAVTMPRPNIAEWGRVHCALRFLPYFLLIALSLSSLWLSKAKRPLFEIITVVLALIFSFLHMRHTVIFALIVAVFMPRHAGSFAEAALLRLEDAGRRIILIPALLLTTFYFSYSVSLRKDDLFRIRVAADIFPVNGVEFLKQNKIGGNIFCQFKWAEMCIHDLSPQNKVFFDGRYETVYSDSLIRTFYEIYSAKNNFAEQLDNFPETDIFFLYAGSPLARAAENDAKWVRIYSTRLARIFVKNNEKNENIIARFKNNTLIYPRQQPPYYLP